jgi:hypothetical protein
MTEGQITFRVDPDLKARIRELVAEGEYRNVSDFVNQAILLVFAFERIPLGGRLLAYDPLAEFFSSYSGRRLLRETMREVQAE